eukprot:CAMPEP_0172497526 /NCGR_PEP_ID=MMETSP1066-20121228/101205_1 /TAXON_ID=671091 /ORGANISM="Coscinodiscus wailesii, Strain CCMP2513" /LENGTH=41 /DNA_ID= /DNA_START= /DNA_END= /DNA_ORIENTATION=
MTMFPNVNVMQRQTFAIVRRFHETIADIHLAITDRFNFSSN